MSDFSRTGSEEFCRKNCSNGKIEGRNSGETCEATNDYHATDLKSGLEIRYVNSAIYTEPVGEEERDAVGIRFDRQREDDYKARVNCGKPSVIDLSDVPLHSATKTETREKAITGQDTYRCYSTTLPDAALSLELSTTRSVVSSGATARIERRCKIDDVLENVCQNNAVKREKYVADNRQVVRINPNDCQVSSDFARRIAYSEWMRRKHEAAQRKREDEERATKQREEEEKMMARKKEEKARLKKENFLKWMEEKRRQELDRKVMFQNELELQKRLKEIEDKAVDAKALYSQQWIVKKKEEQKARHKEQETRLKRINEEREKRLEQCSKAYEKWRQNSKNRPKPATQGLLRMLRASTIDMSEKEMPTLNLRNAILAHQKAKPAYINPIPWQPIVEIASDDTQEETLND